MISWLRRSRNRVTQGDPANPADRPYPPHGPVTALRVIGQGFDVKLDPERTEQVIGRARPPQVDIHLPEPSVSRRHALIRRIPDGLEIIDCDSRNGVGVPKIGLTRTYPRSDHVVATVGSRFVLGSVQLLALDDLTHRLVPCLATHLGRDAEDDIDRALEAVTCSRMLVLRSARTDQYRDLCRTLHAHSIRRSHPFTRIAKPASDKACDEVCARAAWGTLFVDMSRPFLLPLELARNLLSQRFHLWTVIVTPESAEQVLSRFGAALVEPKPRDFGISMVGFSGPYWRGQNGVLRW